MSRARWAAGPAVSLMAVSMLVLGPAIVAAADQSVAVRSQPLVFEDARLTIAVGDIVTWRVDPGTVHTVTSGTYNASGVHPDGLFDSGSLAPGEAFSYAFTTPGEYPYVCTIHADTGMVGRIIVTAAGPSQSPTQAPVSPAPSGNESEPAAQGDGLAIGIAIALATIATIALAWRARTRRA